MKEKFPNVEFSIIADYKTDVLKKYLDINTICHISMEN